MNMVVCIFIALLLLVPQSVQCDETYYQWVDEKGVTHFTDHAPGHHIDKTHGVQEIRVHENPLPQQPMPSMGSPQTNVHPDFRPPSPLGQSQRGYGAEHRHHDRHTHEMPRPPVRPQEVHSQRNHDARVKEMNNYNERVKQYNAQVAEYNKQVAQQKQMVERQSRQQAYREQQHRNQPTNRESGYKPYLSNEYTDRYQGAQVRQSPEFNSRGPVPQSFRPGR